MIMSEVATLRFAPSIDTKKLMKIKLSKQHILRKFSVLLLGTILTMMLAPPSMVTAQGGSISGRVWNDANTNGIVDSGESGISGVTIVLYDVAASTCQSVSTDATGAYSFTGLSNGSYRIYEAAGESIPTPAVCPPTESVADSATSTVTPGTIADPKNSNSSTPNRIDVTLSGSLTDQNFGDFASPPFTICPSDAFLAQNSPTDLYGVNLVTGSYFVLADNWNIYTNGIGFNLLDNYVYGYNRSANNGHITIIDRAFNIFDLKVSGLGSVGAFVGDVSTDGYLYLGTSGNKMWKVDVNPQRTTYLQHIKKTTLSQNSGVADWAFSPVDEMLYGVRKNGHLIQVTPSTGHITDLGDTGITDGTLFGAVYFDKDGYFYASNNGTGKIYRIDLRDPNNLDPTATFFTQGPSSGKNDGARCVFAPVAQLDMGDAPASYGTLLNDDGARHVITTGLALGANNIDAEDDGQPTPGADGDDNDGNDDENGLNGGFPQLASGATTYSVQVDALNSTGNPAYLYGYIDWNNDGDFNDADERSAQVTVNGNGTYTVQWNVPAHPTPNDTYARFRFGSEDAKVSSPIGVASDGEVEDYLVQSLYRPNTLTIVKSATPSDGTQFTFQQDVDTSGDFTLTDGQSKQFTNVASGDYNITEVLPLGWQLDNIICDSQPYYVNNETLTVTLDQGQNVTCTFTNSRKASDYGDAPDTNGQTNGANKAFHVIDPNSPYLGATDPDAEATGIPTTNADGDDKDNIDDEDGLVAMAPNWSSNASIDVKVSNVTSNACVYAWVDWDNDGFGVGSDSSNQVEVTADGTTTIDFTNNLPTSGNFPATTYLRLRVVPGACSSLAPTGGANGGEVEDYKLEFRPTAVTLSDFEANGNASTGIWLGLALLAGGALLAGAFLLKKKLA